MPYTYEYPRPSVTVDCIIFGLHLEKRELKVLLIERGEDPFKGSWALPGGFVNMKEDLDTAAKRELEEETGVKDVFIEQLYTYGNPNRDPRGRVISIAYYALVNFKEHPAQAASDASNADWFLLDEIPSLAFDHEEILEMAIQRLRGKVRYQPIGFELLPKKFTLSDLQTLYEVVLGLEEKSINKRNFRTKILKMGILNRLERQKNVAHRPAFYYEFDKEKYEALTKQGFVFEILMNA